MAEVKTIKINVETNAKAVAKDMQDVSASTNQAAASVENLGATTQEAGTKGKMLADMKNVVTSMVPGLKAAEGGVNSFSASLKALLANPVVLIITAIVASLKFIYEAFQSNVKIGKEIAAVWEGLSAVGTQVKDAIFGLTRSLVYAAEAALKFITLDFKGASDAMKKANNEAATSFNQLTNAANGTTFAIVRGLEKQQQANNKAKKEQAVRESEINKLLVQSREILTDETASIKEKKKALEAVTKAEKESAAEKVRTAKVDLDILKAKAKALGGQAEIKMKQEIREATIALNEAETENAMTGIKLNRQRKMLVRQEISEGKEAAAAAKERAKEKIAAEQELLKAKQDVLEKIRKAEQDYADSLLSDQEKEILAVKRKYEELYKEAAKYKLDITKLKQNEIDELNRLDQKQFEQIQKDLNANKNTKILSATDTLKSVININMKELESEKKASDNKREVLKAEAEFRRSIQSQQIDLALQGIKFVASLFEKQKGVQKAALLAESAIGIAKMIISTKAANAAVKLKYAAIPGGAALALVETRLNNISTGIGIAANVAATAKALKSLGGGSTTTATNPSDAESGGAGGGSITPSFNIVGNSGINQLAQLQQTPVQAYVVSGSVTTAQALDRNRIENATL